MSYPCRPEHIVGEVGCVYHRRIPGSTHAWCAPCVNARGSKHKSRLRYQSSDAAGGLSALLRVWSANTAACTPSPTRHVRWDTTPNGLNSVHTRSSPCSPPAPRPCNANFQGTESCRNRFEYDDVDGTAEQSTCLDSTASRLGYATMRERLFAPRRKRSPLRAPSTGMSNECSN